MSQFVVIHTVEDYEQWKKVFDEDASRRKSLGSKGGRLYRSADNPNEMTIVWDWESLEKARQFATSPDLREVMEKAGVVGMPQVIFLEEIEDGSIVLSAGNEVELAVVLRAWATPDHWRSRKTTRPVRGGVVESSRRPALAGRRGVRWVTHRRIPG